MRTLKYFQHSWLAVFFLILLISQIFREYGFAGIRTFADAAAVVENLSSEFFSAFLKVPV